MLFRRGERAQRCNANGIPTSFEIELFANPADVLRLVIDNREHAAQEKEVAGLYCFDIYTKRGWGGGELNAQFLEPALCTYRL